MQPKPTATGISPYWKFRGLEVLRYKRAYYACERNMNNCGWNTDYDRLQNIAMYFSCPLRRWNLFFFPLNWNGHVTSFGQKCRSKCNVSKELTSTWIWGFAYLLLSGSLSASYTAQITTWRARSTSREAHVFLTISDTVLAIPPIDCRHMSEPSWDS